MPTQFIRDRSRNLLSSLRFAGFSAYFAILARVMSTFKELTLRPLRKGYLEKATICVPHQSGAARRGLTPSQKPKLAFRLPRSAGCVALDEVNERLYALHDDASSAMSRVSFALLRGCDQCLRFVTCPLASGPRPHSAWRVRDQPS